MSNYPGAIDDADDLLIAVNNWWTTLPAAIGSGDTTFNLTDGDLIQDTEGVLSIEDECIYYATITRTTAGATLGGVIRGYDGTIARVHAAGTRVELRWVAAHHNGLSLAIRLLENYIGINPQIDSLNGIPFDNLVDRLASNLPLTVAASGAVWTITHNRNRVVGVQVWVSTGTAGQYTEADVPIVQQVNPAGTSTITIDFNLTAPATVSGYVTIY
jgi:hypothetical protein